MLLLPTFEDVLAAKEVVHRHLPPTPLVHSWSLSRYCIKCENLQPVGAGNGLVARSLRPQTRIIGVQSERAPAVYWAWRERHLRPYPRMETEHEGLATRVPFELTVRLLGEVLDDFVLVSDEEINAAVRLLAERAHWAAEGTGAAPLAAAFRLRERLRGKKVVGILSGGNLPAERLARILRSADPRLLEAGKE